MNRIDLTTKYYYRINCNDTISHRCPKKKEQVQNIKDWKEREHWSQLAGVTDEEMNAYRIHKEKLLKQLVCGDAPSKTFKRLMRKVLLN
jgi:hypothetical protein